jgi:hypothetical protein
MSSNLTLTNPRLDISPIADPDLIRYERNLLRIGFFAAQQAERKRTPPPYKRRIEATFSNGQGQRVLSAIEFESTCGLPATADRDKYMAFMKIVDEQRSLNGVIANPIRFTGYRLLQELGLTDSGENYEDINSWGERMAKTTITSRQVVFIPKTKRYANRTIHVFESFERVGSVTDKKTAEVFDVVLADWLLDNLNTDYAIAEDFTAYKALERDTAKGLFPLIHWWFASNGCREFEKDYKDLCMLLGIKEYKYYSENKRTMGKALDELIGIRYLSKWEIKRKVSQNAYKVVIWPGAELTDRLSKQQPRLTDSSQTAGLPEETSAPPVQNDPNLELTVDMQQALDQLKSFGINKAVGQSLVTKYGPEKVSDVADYVASIKEADHKLRIKNAAGLVIYYLRDAIPIPASFITSRNRRAMETASLAERQRREDAQALEVAYHAWRTKQVESELAARYPGDFLLKKIKEVAALKAKSDPYFARVTDEQRVTLARLVLAKEIREEMTLQSFEEWSESNKQYSMF